MITPDELEHLIATARPRNTGTPLDSVFNPPPSKNPGLISLGLGYGLGAYDPFHDPSLPPGPYGLGAAASPNVAPQGQHSNAELPGKLTEAKATQQKLATLYQNVANALSTNQALLVAAPQTAGLVATAQNALSDLQVVASQLEGSLWNGTNFNNFSGSTDAWNAMNTAIQAANQKLSTYAQLPNQLAAGVAQAQSVQDAARAKAAADQAAANQAAADQARALVAAQNKVQSAILSANSAAALNDFPRALGILADSSIVSAANAAGIADQLQNAVNSITTQQASSARAAADAAAAEKRRQDELAAAQRAADAQAARQAQLDAEAARRADSIAQAQAAQAQGAFDLQRFQAQLAADAAARAAEREAASADRAAELEADRRARQDQLDKLQLLLTAAPILGKDVVASAFANELGLAPAAAEQAAAQAGAGTQIAFMDSNAQGAAFSGFGAETF